MSGDGSLDVFRYDQPEALGDDEWSQIKAEALRWLNAEVAAVVEHEARPSGKRRTIGSLDLGGGSRVYVTVPVKHEVETSP